MKAAVIYHYLAHYRLPVFSRMMLSKEVEYNFFSGKDSEIKIRKIEENYAEKPLNEGGLRWHFFTNKWLLKGKFLWQSGLIKLMLKGDFDAYIFLGSPYHLSTWAGAVIARLKGKKVYYWMHGVYKDKLTIVDYLKLYLFYKIPNGFFLYGNRSANIILKREIKAPQNVHVIYNSLDYDKCLANRKLISAQDIKEFRSKYFKNAHLPTVIFIGRLTPAKGIHYLLEAMNLLNRKYQKPFFNLVIIGDGEERALLENLSSSYGLSENICFLGEIYDEDVNAALLIHADLCVTPGDVGLTAIHALSYGTPVISHNNLSVQMPEVEAIVPGFNGDLFEYRNIENLGSTIQNWFEKHPEKTVTVMKNCYKVVDDYYNPHYQVKVFDEVLKSSRK